MDIIPFNENQSMVEITLKNSELTGRIERYFEQDISGEDVRLKKVMCLLENSILLDLDLPDYVDSIMIKNCKGEITLREDSRYSHKMRIHVLNSDIIINTGNRAVNRYGLDGSAREFLYFVYSSDIKESVRNYKWLNSMRENPENISEIKDRDDIYMVGGISSSNIIQIKIDSHSTTYWNMKNINKYKILNKGIYTSPKEVFRGTGVTKVNGSIYSNNLSTLGELCLDSLIINRYF